MKICVHYVFRKKRFTDSYHSLLADVSFTLQDVMKQLHNGVMDRLRKDKSAGADGLSTTLLMEAKDEICYLLFIIFKK